MKCIIMADEKPREFIPKTIKIVIESQLEWDDLEKSLGEMSTFGFTEMLKGKVHQDVATNANRILEQVYYKMSDYKE